MCVSSLFFFKQETSYEMGISDWSSDVCSSDLAFREDHDGPAEAGGLAGGGDHPLQGPGAPPASDRDEPGAGKGKPEQRRPHQLPLQHEAVVPQQDGEDDGVPSRLMLGGDENR